MPEPVSVLADEGQLEAPAAKHNNGLGEGTDFLTPSVASSNPLLSSSSIDDADGLTNTQEQWWCTDPQVADSDGDGISDGAEVQAAKNWLGNRRSGPPASGSPFKGWPMVPGDGKFHNFMPGEEHTYTARRIPLSLEQMKAVDLGGPVRIVVEDFSYGVDELFYQDAVNAGVLVAMEDGTDDGDEAIDTYLIPTWGDGDTVQNVIARYFPYTADADGNLIAIWTPEVRSDTPAWCNAPQRVGTTLWCKHALSTADWWNIYLNNLGDGTASLKDTPAAPNSTAFFRFNTDSDLDGYSDRSEVRLGIDPHDPASHPRPELIAGVHSVRSSNNVTATLSLLNTGLYDAYGVEAVMIAPDDSVSIANNTVGGSGRVRARKQVIVGSRIVLPDPLPSQWTATGHARPASGGYYTGSQDRTYAFTVQCSAPGGCDVGAGTWSLAWNDGAGNSGTLDFGAGYASPRLLDVGTLGVKLSLLTGKVYNADTFTVAARTPRDTFQYAIKPGRESDFTVPIVLVSYNDPQGNHRFVVPPAAMALSQPTDNLTTFSGQMLTDPGVEIVTTEPFNPQSPLSNLQLVLNNPTEKTLANAHLFLEFVNITGTVASEVPVTVTLPAGPSVVPVTWNTDVFSPTFRADQDYIVMAFWTDYQGNILDTAARPLSSFQSDPRPFSAMALANEVWDFGTAQQGTLLQRRFTLASTGYMDLLTYLGTTTGLTVEGPTSRRLPPGDMAVYTVTLNTQYLPTDAFERTIPVRTSDAEHPTRSITIRGNVTPMPPDSPGGATLRPLDSPVTLIGAHNQGEWVEFTHTLGPDPASLHPVKVYSQDYGRLWGVGKYATDFGPGTAPYDMFGDGRDGDLVVTSSVDLNPVRASASGTAGSSVLAISNVTGGGFQNNQLVLIHQSRGTNAGVWELNSVKSAELTQLTLTKPLSNTYATDAGASRAQVLWAPQYHDVTVNAGATVSPAAWDGNVGGILAFLSNGTTTDNGTVTVSAKGYRGGSGNSQRFSSGTQGEGATGTGTQSSSANGIGGGAGGSTDTAKAGGGGGGGHATNGTNGTGREDFDGFNGTGGGTIGQASLVVANFGGGGGGSGCGDDVQGITANGGGGGGFILIGSKTLTVAGSISASGEVGVNGVGDHGGGGDSAGGAILLKGQTLTLGTNLVTATGGTGGTNGGGAGGAGRIRVEYCETLSGSINPPASTQKLNCYIAEQLESAPYSHARLNLPESFTDGRTYNVQFGRRYVFGAAGQQTQSIRLPKQIYASASLDALVSNTGVSAGNLNLCLDLGNDGACDFTYSASTTFPATLNATGLATALNAYLLGRTDIPWGSPVDVPVRVQIDRQADVMLTNLALTPVGAKTRFLRLPARAYSNVIVSLQFKQPGVPSGPLAFTVDVGANGSIDWSYSGTPSFPATLASPNLAAAFNTYLSGRTGDVDVPLRIVPSPALDTALYNFAATPSARPDVTLTASDITFGSGLLSTDFGHGLNGLVGDSANPLNPFPESVDSSALLTPLSLRGRAAGGEGGFPQARAAGGAGQITEGDTIPITATLHNTGNADSGPLTTSFFATAPGWGQTYIGSAFVPNVPANGSAPAAIPWNTLGFTGTVPVRVVADPYNRVAETNENNNAAVANVTIHTRPDLRIPTIALSDDEPVVGEPVTVTLTLRNAGQTTAGTETAALFKDNPESSGKLIASRNVPALPGGTDTTVTFTWTPTATGAVHLFAQADRNRQVSEFDEGNNLAWRDVYVGFRGPLLLDSGNGAADPTYTTARGYGAVDQGQPDELGNCGSAAHQTFRRDPGGRLIYRFDHLQPGHFYHLDLTLYLCGAAGRQESVYLDGNLVAGPEDLGDGRMHRLSLRLDPALYADRTISATIETAGLGGSIVNEVNLYDVDYRYSDAGCPVTTGPDCRNDPPYTPERGYGYLPGSVARTQWGTLPYRSLRENQTSNSVSYRYDGLDPAKRYAVHLTFWQATGATVSQKIQLDGVDIGSTLNLPSGSLAAITVNPPSSSYAGGSLVVTIVRLDAQTSAMVNEIALEELTLTTETACGATVTPSFTEVYGSLTLNGQPAPAGAIVQAISPRGDTVGCFTVSAAGRYGFLRIYGEDPTANPPIPGLRDGEPVAFRVNGAPDVATPLLYWQADRAAHQVDLAVDRVEGQIIPLALGWNLISIRNEPTMPVVSQVLSPINGRYDRVLGETGIYIPTLADTYNTLKELHTRKGYYLRLAGSTSANLLVEGSPQAANSPIALHPGWNWIGYLPASPLPVAEALQSVNGLYQRVLSLDKSYDPALPDYSQLKQMEAGQGYLIYMNQTATLTYPASAALLSPGLTMARAASTACAHLQPTPYATLVYGTLTINATPAPAGTRVEILTPRGEVAGRYEIERAGQYGLIHVFGADPTANPPIPGFKTGETLRFRVNGLEVPPSEPLAWHDDKAPHRVDLTSAVERPYHVYLPLVH